MDSLRAAGALSTGTTAAGDGAVSAERAASSDARSSTDAAVARLGVELARHARLLHTMKAHLSDLMPPGVDWATFGVLVQLVKCGATRQADLAGASMLDPSTVSRYVGQLVRQGLVERQPDPQDGRAVRLVATEPAQAIVEEVVRRRNQAFLAALQGWSAEDLHTLTDLITRFNDDLEAFRQDPSRAGPSTQRPSAPGPARSPSS